VTAFIDLPPEEKKKRKERKHTGLPPYSGRWLGVVPFILKSSFKKAK
jgi:hypothetical protein